MKKSQKPVSRTGKFPKHRVRLPKLPAQRSPLKAQGRRQTFAEARPAVAAPRSPVAKDKVGDSWAGRLSVNPRGFGFVNASGHEDVFINPTEIGHAMHGDLVRVEVTSRASRGLEGVIREIVERRRPEVAGILRRRGKSAWLEPDDSRIRGPIVLWAKGLTGKDGEAAVARIERFPNYADENPEGTLLAVLGDPSDPQVQVQKILVRVQIDQTHSEAAITEARELIAELSRERQANRTDLRHLPLPTIDPKDARDHDDALWAESIGSGFQVTIAIADVSEYVREGSLLDQEARARGNTIYLPDRAIPMLPGELAADVCSLLPNAERLCLAVIVDLDKSGAVKGFELAEGLMLSKAKLTYDQVARTLGLTQHGPLDPDAESLKTGLSLLFEISEKLRKKRFDRGALGLDLPEAEVILDPVSKRPLGVDRRGHDPGVKRAYAIVEEFMLLANELVARYLTEKKCPAIYRVHERPAPEKLERLAQIAEVVGVSFDPEEMQTPTGVSRWLEAIKSHERRAVLEMALLRSLKQAVYHTINVGHFGLASERYLHFTSPIRRYPDLLVHRIVKRLLRGLPPDLSASAIESLNEAAQMSSARERATMDIEREVVDLYRAIFMQDKVGELYEGTVTGIGSSGAYVTLKEVFVDVLVRFESLGPDHYELDEHELGLVGVRSGDRVALGDTVLVTIEDVALLRRTVYARRIPPETAQKGLGAKKSEAPRERRHKGQHPSEPKGSARREKLRGEDISPRAGQKVSKAAAVRRQRSKRGGRG